MGMIDGVYRGRGWAEVEYDSVEMKFVFIIEAKSGIVSPLSNSSEYTLTRFLCL